MALDLIIRGGTVITPDGAGPRDVGVQGEQIAIVAQADTLQQLSPGHLFVMLVRGEAARRSGDAAALRRAYRSFLDTADQEEATGKQEYAAHQRALDAFRDAARAALGSAR